MRREHKSHVVIISIMLLVIVIVFGFVLFNKASGSGVSAGITTSLSSYPVGALGGMGAEAIQPVKNTTQTETEILLAFLIIIAFLFAVYMIVKIIREVKAHMKGS